MTTGFDWQTALTAVELLERAHSRFRETEASLITASVTGQARRSALLRAVGPLAEALTWVRTLDDLCQDKDRKGAEPLPDYKELRDQDVTETDDLAALRYAGNKIIHVVAELARPTPVLVTPIELPGEPDRFGRLTWAGEGGLPTIVGDWTDDLPGRNAYLNRLATHQIEPTVNNAVEHFRWWLTSRGRGS
ncbi:hypothetical protein [Pseudonocardia alni]|uniref:hypothetical protein n=1 Tax=Pseudonocardia alni TaxID=33907 RepID=UPI0033302C19